MKSEAFQKRIEDENVEGWKVKEDGDNRVVLQKSNYGSLGPHVLVALLTIWWIRGDRNVVYAAYCYWSRSDQKVVRDEAAT